MFDSSIFYIVAVLACWGQAAPHPHGDSLKVSTSSGHVTGVIEDSNPHVRQFLGIPFAQPPVNTLRFEPPQPLSQPDANIDATQLPVSCMQYLTNQGNSLYVRDVLQFNLEGLNTTGAISEDCLTLSVWAPTNAPNTRHHQQGLPVLIFIYGGGFSTGGENVPYQLPPQWVERTQDHIVVSFNYRLNIFGFPNAAGLSTQNLGLLDQRLAVEWLQSNIGAFGGDRTRMVLWGQSAGSGSVDYFNYAYPTNTIVSGLIMDSGDVFSPQTYDLTHSNFSFVASHVGCGGLDAVAEVTCMKKLPADTLENFFAQYQESGATPGIAFTVIPDGKVVFANYIERAKSGNFSKVPAIVGTNAQDGEPFAPYVPSGPNQTIAQQQLLSKFFCPTTETVRVRDAAGRLTYRYLYAGNFSNIAPRPWEGAYHSSELPLLMGSHPNYRGNSTPLEYATSHAMQDAWVAFASNTTGGLASQDWKPYTVGSGYAREFGKGVAAQDTNLTTNEAMCNGASPAM